jgi:hypothetical protein
MKQCAVLCDVSRVVFPEQILGRNSCLRRSVTVTYVRFVLFTYVGFEVFTPVVMNSSIFWGIPLYSPLKVKFLVRLILLPRIWRPYIPPKRRLIFNGLQSRSACLLLSRWFLACLILRPCLVITGLLLLL